ncbi:hypothetical protein [Muriicola sp.]|uniref:hypothetical protein n=1 Tax=Muriicola sp. TaxID=2020856 RepID=UPI003C73A3E5
MKKITVRFVFLVMLVSSFSCSKDETTKEGQQILYVEDLSVLFSKENKNTSSKGDCPMGLEDVKAFPVNGCSTFTIKQTIKYIFGETTIETKVTVCCVCAACIPMKFSSKNSAELMKKGKIEGISVDASSSISYQNYVISIAEGDYEVDANGEIKTLVYKVIVK